MRDNITTSIIGTHIALIYTSFLGVSCGQDMNRMLKNSIFRMKRSNSGNDMNFDNLFRETKFLPVNFDIDEKLSSYKTLCNNIQFLIYDCVSYFTWRNQIKINCFFCYSANRRSEKMLCTETETEDNWRVFNLHNQVYGNGFYKVKSLQKHFLSFSICVNYHKALNQWNNRQRDK